MGISIQSELDKKLEDKGFAAEYGENIAKAEIAVTVSQARRSRNLTQEDLAMIVNTSQSYIAKLEGGDANPTVGSVGRILAKMGLRLVAGLSSLGSRIEEKGLSYCSYDSNAVLLSWAGSMMSTNIDTGLTAAKAPYVQLYDYGNVKYYFNTMVFGFVVGSNNVSEGFTEVLWQAPEEDKKGNMLELKGGK